MSCKVEKLGVNKAKFVIEVSNDEMMKVEDKVFNKQKAKLSIPGFRKGKITKDMAFKVYGREAFLEDTINECINETYYKEIKETNEKVLSQPKIKVVQAEVGKNLIYEAEAAIIPDITLATYKGVNIKKSEVKISDEEIDNKLKEEQEKNARLVSVDRKSKLGDILTIDFDGYVDGIPFKGGKAEKYPLTLGTHTFIDTFEDQLVDRSVEEIVNVNVTFPENYQEKTLAGKYAVFKVRILEIKEKQLPEINDEFASEISEFETLNDFKEDIKKKLTEEKEKNCIEQDKDKIVEEIIKNTTIDLAEEAIDTQAEDMIYNYEQRLKYQGLTLEKYLEMIGKSYEDYKKQILPNAEKILKNSIVLEKIAKDENIEATDVMVDEEITNMAKAYGMDVEQFKKTYENNESRARLKEDLLYPAVRDFLYKNANLS